MSAGTITRGEFAIVGVGEPDTQNRVPEKTELSMGTEALLKATDDAGISIKDIDGWFVPGGPSPNQAGEYVGVFPSYADGGNVGAVSPIAMVGHAMAAINAGYCSIAAVLHTQLSRSGPRGGGGGDTSSTIGGQFIAPYGIEGEYSRHGMVANRYNQTYGTEMSGFAELAVSNRKWAQLHPRAAYTDPMTVEDVLNARILSWPITLPMVCPVLDNASAIIITSADRAKDMNKNPISILGFTQEFEMSIDFKEDLLDWEMIRKSGEKLFPMAGVSHNDIDLVQTHDCFIPVPILEIEGLGFCEKGEGLAFVADGRTAPGGDFPMNTNGGGLSYSHSGSFGLASICDTVEQLRGESGPRQITDANIGLVTGSGGGFTTNTSIILTNQ